jgi:hypothetical protein
VLVDASGNFVDDLLNSWVGRIGEWLSGFVYAALLAGISLGSGVWRADERNHLAGLLARYPQLRFLSELLAANAPGDTASRKS